MSTRDQPSFFDASASSSPPWREVPQAVFLSWSAARQLSYCAARDRDAEGLDDGLAKFYRERAASYEELQRAAM